MNKQTLVLVLIGLALRLFLIFPGPLTSKVEFFTNWADLRNYYWPAQTALTGANPYVLWASGKSGEFRADMEPLELLVYTATVAVWNDMRAIQVLFTLFDVINITLLGLLLKNSPLRLPFQIFYALGPLTVYNLVLVPEDKTIVLTLTFVLFYLLTLPRDLPWRVSPGTLAVIVAALIGSFKWLSVFFLLPLLLFVSPDVRAFVKNGLLFSAVVALSHLPWIPAWVYVYEFRFTRVTAPMHVSLSALLNALGLFNRTAILGAAVIAMLAIYALFWFKRIDIFETIALSAMVGILWTPDMDPVHLSLVVIYLLLVVDWTSRARLLTVWGLSAWVAAVYAISTRTGYARYGLPDLRIITGVYSSPQMIVLSYLLFVAVFSLYLYDKWRGRAVGKILLGVE